MILVVFHQFGPRPVEGKNMDDSVGFGQYDAACRELAQLGEEFEYAAALPLDHQLISPLDGPWTPEKWASFILANTHSGGDRQEFQVFADRRSCARFFGAGSLDAFIRLAERGMATLRKISRMREEGKVILPEGLILRLPSALGHLGWIQLLYETARCYPTPLLHAEAGYWGCTGQFNWDAEGNPAHPFYEELRYDLFRSSAEAIRLFSVTEANITGDRITDEPPVYLPPEPEENGPRPVNKFWLWGKPYESTPKPWRLLEFLWGKKEVKKEDAGRHIYGGADDVEDRFRSLVKRLQSELAQQNCPAEVHTKGEYIWLDVFQPKPA
jgi:hypothetical protein